MKKYLLFTLAFLSLTACSDNVKRDLGIKKMAPDEFTVISHPPLVSPPDFELEEPGVRAHTNVENNYPLSPFEQEILDYQVTSKNS